MGYILMNKNIPVYNFGTGKILNKDMLPLLGITKDSMYNNDILREWLRSRALPINRKNADKIYTAAGLPREGYENRLMEITRGLSLNDCFWLIDSNELGKVHWENVNIYNNSLNNAISYLMFSGNGKITITGDEISPEFTGRGTYAKCFVRKGQDLVMYKAGKISEIYGEIYAAYTADILGFRHIDYWFDKFDNVDVSACKIYTNEKIGWVDAATAKMLFHSRGSSLIDTAASSYRQDFLQMLLFDGIVNNPDRHLGNWAFDVDNDTNQIIGLSPLYDLNRAFHGTYGEPCILFPKHNTLYIAREANKILGYDLINILVPYLKNYPEKWQEPMYNRLLYLTGRQQTQRNCY